MLHSPLSVSPSSLFCFRFIPPFFILGKGVKVLWWFCHFRGIGRRNRIAFVTARSWHQVWATAIGTLIETLYVFIASSTSLSQRPSHWRLVMFFQCTCMCVFGTQCEPNLWECAYVWLVWIACLDVCVCFIAPYVCRPIKKHEISLITQLFLLDSRLDGKHLFPEKRSK